MPLSRTEIATQGPLGRPSTVILPSFLSACALDGLQGTDQQVEQDLADLIGDTLDLLDFLNPDLDLDPLLLKAALHHLQRAVHQLGQGHRLPLWGRCPGQPSHLLDDAGDPLHPVRVGRSSGRDAREIGPVELPCEVLDRPRSRGRPVEEARDVS